MDQSCCSGGTVTSGLCPGSSSVQCCTNPTCSTPQGDGNCMDTSECKGTPLSGHCVGPSNIQCCVQTSPTPPSPPSPSPPPSPRPASTKGVDLAGACSASTLSCLSKAGYSFGIFRAFHSTGTPDTTACPNIMAAHSSGMSYADVYMFPCPKCSATAQAQVSSMISSLKSGGCNWTSGSQGKNNFGKIWLDIEGTQYWGGQSANQGFFNGLVAGCRSAGVSCGVYSSASQWNPIFGSSFTGGSAMPLWYAHYDNSPSFGDFSSFGGWKTPYMKQYNGDQTVCGFDVDLNWTPNMPLSDEFYYRDT